MFMQKLIKKQITLSIITFIFLIVIISGSSYALFSETFSDTNTQTLNVGDLNIAFANTSGDELSASDAINMTDVFPMSDAEGIAANNNLYTFVIRNDGNIAYDYTVRLVDNANYNQNLLNHMYLRYKLNDDVPRFLAPNGDHDAAINDLIYSYTINPGETHTFRLKIWLGDPATYDIPNTVLGKEVHLNILVEGEAGEKREPSSWANPGSGTLLAGIKANYSAPTATVTTPGRTISTSLESVMAETVDDYGTSYYFRGAVENNYVVFAEMCWRIVRIDGLGNIKLVLSNYNPNEVSNPCATSEDALTVAYARYDDGDPTLYSSEFNSTVNKNTYVGYMYSNSPDSNDFNTAHANDGDSTILTNLKTWYDLKLRDYNDQIADVIWCNDKSIEINTEYNPKSFSSVLATGLGTDNTYYKTSRRLSSTSDAVPSLVCPSAGADGKLSKFTARDTVNGNAKLYSDSKEYKIGLLTADEIAFAGASLASNSTYYLYKNANDGAEAYWTLSPAGFYNGYAGGWSVNYDGEFSPGDAIDAAEGLRPSIALKSTVTMTTTSDTNKGTAGNPFIIDEE